MVPQAPPPNLPCQPVGRPRPRHRSPEGGGGAPGKGLERPPPPLHKPPPIPRPCCKPLPPRTSQFSPSPMRPWGPLHASPHCACSTHLNFEGALKPIGATLGSHRLLCSLLWDGEGVTVRTSLFVTGWYGSADGYMGKGQGCIRREGTSEPAPEAVGQAVGGGYESGWGRLLSATNAIEAGTWRQGDSGWA